MDSTELLSIRLATGSEVILGSMYNILEVFYYVGRHAITQCTTCQNTPNLFYDTILGINWLKTTNPVIDWVACSLELTGC